MREFFKGWRRKSGSVALVIALAFMAGWVRSLLVFDSFNIHAGTMHSIGIESKRQSLCFSWVQDNSVSNVTIPFWMALDPSLQGTELPDDYKIGELACLVNLGDEYPHGIILAAPYWYVTTPLALLSGYLILWNPRRVALAAAPGRQSS